MEYSRYKCSRCGYNWSGGESIIEALRCCKKCMTSYEEQMRVQPWLTKMFTDYRIGVKLKSKLIRSVVSDHFNKINKQKEESKCIRN